MLFGISSLDLFDVVPLAGNTEDDGERNDDENSNDNDDNNDDEENGNNGGDYGRWLFLNAHYG